MRALYTGVKCKEKGCDGQVISKGFCRCHYSKDYYRRMNPEERLKLSRRHNERYRKRRRNDPKFDESERQRHRKASRDFFRRKCEREPEWNAKRQREHRRRNPDSFNFTMAKWYFLRLKGKYKKMFMEMMRDG